MKSTLILSLFSLASATDQLSPNQSTSSLRLTTQSTNHLHFTNHNNSTRLTTRIRGLVLGPVGSGQLINQWSIQNDKVFSSTVDSSNGQITNHELITRVDSSLSSPVTTTSTDQIAIWHNHSTNQLSLNKLCSINSLPRCVQPTQLITVSGLDQVVLLEGELIWVASGKLYSYNDNQITPLSTNQPIHSIKSLTGQLSDEYFIARLIDHSVQLYRSSGAQLSLISQPKPNGSVIGWTGYRNQFGEAVIYSIENELNTVTLKPINQQSPSIVLSQPEQSGQLVSVEVETSTDQLVTKLWFKSGLIAVYHNSQVVFTSQSALDWINLGPISLDRATQSEPRKVWVASSAYHKLFTINQSLKSEQEINLGTNSYFTKLSIDRSSPYTAQLTYATNSNSTTNSVHFDPLTANLLPNHSTIQIGQLERTHHSLSRSSLSPEFSSWEWSVAPGEVILATVQPIPIGRVGSIGRVLGNRTTLIKYLNPNLIGLITHQSANHSAGSVRLMDGQSGKLIHKLKLDNINPNSIKLVINQHRIIISATQHNQLARQSIIHSLELYSSDQSELVTVLSRSFISPDGLQIAHFTQSQNQITTSNPLFLSWDGLVVTVPARMVDPRRTYSSPTSQDYEEQVIKYDPILNLETRMILSPLDSFESVSSFAGERESETIILASGPSGTLWRTASPSGQFDRLSNQFNQTQLIITISTLAIALLIATRLVGTNKVRAKWYSD